MAVLVAAVAAVLEVVVLEVVLEVAVLEVAILEVAVLEVAVLEEVLEVAVLEVAVLGTLTSRAAHNNQCQQKDTVADAEMEAMATAEKEAKVLVQSRVGMKVVLLRALVSFRIAFLDWMDVGSHFLLTCLLSAASLAADLAVDLESTLDQYPAQAASFIDLDAGKADRCVLSTGRQTDRQTGRQTDRQTDRHADRQTYRQTDRPSDRQRDRQPKQLQTTSMYYKEHSRKTAYWQPDAALWELLLVALWQLLRILVALSFLPSLWLPHTELGLINAFKSMHSKQTNQYSAHVLSQ